MHGSEFLQERTRHRWPGDPAFWSMICGDMMVFGVVFNIFMWDRSHDVGTFINGSRHLNEATGIIFTILMLVSSWFVVMALHYARSGRNQMGIWMVLLALASGFAFCILKVVDYHEKVTEGFTPATDLFFTYYFSVTGMHLFHVIAAMVAMLFVLKTLRKKIMLPADVTFIESVAVFWHLTDLLWVMIFALIYLVR